VFEEVEAGHSIVISIEILYTVVPGSGMERGMEGVFLTTGFLTPP
jgi:hypothetical protein